MNLIADYRFIDTDFRHEARGKKKDEGFAAEKGEKEFAQSDFAIYNFYWFIYCELKF